MSKNPQGGLRLLFADDEAHLRELMQMELPRMGHDVTVCPDGASALKALEKGTYDAALLDLKMPGLTGIEVLGKIKQISPETQVVILTGHATVDTAVQALRLGAFDYLTKPCKWAELEVILARLAERRDLSNKAVALETRLKAAEGTPTLVGESAQMKAVVRLIDTVAPHDASVLILGETGTGKEMVARAILQKSLRAVEPCRSCPVNCGASVRNTWSRANCSATAKARSPTPTSGPQGDVRGGQRRHLIFGRSWANSTRAIQVKLLRFLESGEVRSVVGDNQPFRTDVRVRVRDQPRPARHDRGQGAVPRRPMLYRSQHVRDPAAGAARAGRTDLPDARRCTCCRGSGEGGRGRPGGGAADARRRWRDDAWRTTGRATSASWPTRWSARPSSPAAA